MSFDSLIFNANGNMHGSLVEATTIARKNGYRMVRYGAYVYPTMDGTPTTHIFHVVQLENNKA